MVEHFIGTALFPAVHAHIEPGIKTQRKATFCAVKLVAAYAEVGQYAVYFFDAQPKEPVLHVPEILPDKNQAVVVRHILQRIRILVKSHQLSAFTEVFQYFP